MWPVTLCHQFPCNSQVSPILTEFCKNFHRHCLENVAWQSKRKIERNIVQEAFSVSQYFPWQKLLLNIWKLQHFFSLSPLLLDAKRCYFILTEIESALSWSRRWRRGAISQTIECFYCLLFGWQTNKGRLPAIWTAFFALLWNEQSRQNCTGCTEDDSLRTAITERLIAVLTPFEYYRHRPLIIL